jgi:hypothetical protein
MQLHQRNESFPFNLLTTKDRPLYLKTQFVPRSKIFSSRLQKTNHLELYRGKFTICCEINTNKKHTSVVCHNVKILEC